MIWRYLINHHLVGFQILSVYECDRAKDLLGCVPLRWSGSVSVILDHSDHGTSNEPMNPRWTRIHRFIWFTMIRVISDLWYLSGSSQGNAPLVFYTVLLGLVWKLIFCSDPQYRKMKESEIIIAKYYRGFRVSLPKKLKKMKWFPRTFPHANCRVCCY